MGPGPETFWRMGPPPSGSLGQSSSFPLDSAPRSSARGCPRGSLLLPCELADVRTSGSTCRVQIGGLAQRKCPGASVESGKERKEGRKKGRKKERRKEGGVRGVGAGGLFSPLSSCGLVGPRAQGRVGKGALGPAEQGPQPVSHLPCPGEIPR